MLEILCVAFPLKKQREENEKNLIRILHQPGASRFGLFLMGKWKHDASQLKEKRLQL